MSHPKATTVLLSAFCKVRILNYAAAKPIQRPWILERLCAGSRSLPGPALNRILLGLARTGCLKINGQPGPRAPRTYSLTPKGRQVLTLARKRLQNLAEALRRP